MKRYANPAGNQQILHVVRARNTGTCAGTRNEGCGSSPVYIQNQATANLYYYTPYQPNAAAIRAGYGEGDGCSSYGNRNFYQYFTDWFGSSQGETLQVLQVSGTGETYLVSQGGRWRLPTAEIAAQFTWIAAWREVNRSELDAFQDGERQSALSAPQAVSCICSTAASDCECATARNSQTSGGTSTPCRSPAMINWRAIATVASWSASSVAAISRISFRAALVVRSSIWASCSGSAFRALLMGLGGDACGVSGIGSRGRQWCLPRPRRRLSPAQTDAGTYQLPDAAGGTPIARSARELTSESLAYLKAQSTVPVRMTSGGRSYLMLEDSWLEVAASQYPSTLGFSTLPAGAATGLPLAGQVTGPAFHSRAIGVAGLPDLGRYGAGGLQRGHIVDIRDLRRQLSHLRCPRRRHRRCIDDGGTGAQQRGAAYLLDGARAYRMRDCGQVAAWVETARRCRR